MFNKKQAVKAATAGPVSAKACGDWTRNKEPQGIQRYATTKTIPIAKAMAVRKKKR
jgi:hypothetical protein